MPCRQRRQVGPLGAARVTGEDDTRGGESPPRREEASTSGRGRAARPAAPLRSSTALQDLVMFAAGHGACLSRGAKSSWSSPPCLSPPSAIQGRFWSHVRQSISQCLVATAVRLAVRSHVALRNLSVANHHPYRHCLPALAAYESHGLGWDLEGYALCALSTRYLGCLSQSACAQGSGSKRFAESSLLGTSFAGYVPGGLARHTVVVGRQVLAI